MSRLSRFFAILLPLLALMLTWTACDSITKKKKKSDSQESPPPATAPSDWNGTNDWEGSTFRFKDLKP